MVDCTRNHLIRFVVERELQEQPKVDGEAAAAGFVPLAGWRGELAVVLDKREQASECLGLQFFAVYREAQLLMHGQ